MLTFAALAQAPFVPRGFPTATTSRRPRRSPCRARFQLPGSVAKVEHVATGTRVYILGCVHGSRVSSDDVKMLLDSTSPDAVVVELCQSRLDSLRTVLNNDARDRATSRKAQTPPKRRRTFRQISKTFGGAGPALVAVILELTYKLQLLAGVKPGVEFSYPISGSSRWRLVCGDAPARDTVGNLYRVFASPAKSVRDSMSAIEDLIARIVFPPESGINIPHLFLSDPRRLRELGRLVLPAVLLSTAASLAGSAGASALESTPAINIIAQGYAASILPLFVSVAQTVAVSYVIVSTLHFMKVLISDRDRILTQSILDTATALRTSQTGSTTICAVVGLLHVNGIVRYLQETSTFQRHSR